MSAQEFDLVVIGGGNAIALARRAAGAGKRVALIERDLLGGTCPNRGCIPSKLLLGYADVARTIRDAHRFHIDAELHHIDTDTILVETQAATIGGTDRYFADHIPDGMTLFRGTGSFVGERLVEVTAADGTTTRLTAPQVLIGTGSRPRRPQGMDDVPYWTSDEVFSLARLPQSVAVVGGGFIACELAYFLHAMGVPTEVLVRGDGLLLQADGDARRKFEAGFTARVPTRLNTEVVSAESVEVDGYRQIRVTTKGPDGERTFEVEALLYAIGRVPNTDSLNCAVAGIELDDRGYVKVDDRLRTTADGVYALGDVTGGYQFTHSASFEATYLGDVLLDGRDAPLEYGPMPAAVFSKQFKVLVQLGQDLGEIGVAKHGTRYFIRPKDFVPLFLDIGGFPALANRLQQS